MNNLKITKDSLWSTQPVTITTSLVLGIGSAGEGALLREDLKSPWSRIFTSV
jgi:hypothetical protein